MITSSNGEVYITNSSNVPLGFEFITVDDFKISAVGGKSKGMLKSNKGKGVSFSIVNDTDKDKFTLSGTALPFEATDFKDGGDNNYHVKIRPTRGFQNQRCRW
jgi:hypothetical protein